MCVYCCSVLMLSWQVNTGTFLAYRSLTTHSDIHNYGDDHTTGVVKLHSRSWIVLEHLCPVWLILELNSVPIISFIRTVFLTFKILAPFEINLSISSNPDIFSSHHLTPVGLACVQLDHSRHSGMTFLLRNHVLAQAKLSPISLPISISHEQETFETIYSTWRQTR